MEDSSSPGHNALCFLTAFPGLLWSVLVVYDPPVQRGEGGPAWFPTLAYRTGQYLSAAPTPPFSLGRSQPGRCHSPLVLSRCLQMSRVVYPPHPQTHLRFACRLSEAWSDEKREGCIGSWLAGLGWAGLAGWDVAPEHERAMPRDWDPEGWNVSCMHHAADAGAGAIATAIACFWHRHAYQQACNVRLMVVSLVDG